MNAMVSRRWRTVALLAVGILIGTTMAGTPATAHVTTSVAHLVKHMKGTFFTKAESEARYLNTGEKAASAAQADRAASAAQADNATSATSAASAANADMLDGNDSAAFLRANAKAADANLFDGMDSNVFVTSSTAAGGDLAGAYPNPAIRSNAIGSDEVQLNSLNGADVDEASLAEVPNAMSAQSVDGQSATTFNFKSVGPYADAWTTLSTVGGLTLRAKCSAVSGGTDFISVDARTTANNSFIWSSIDDSEAVDNGDWDVADGNPKGSNVDSWFDSNSDRTAVIVYRQGDTSPTNAAPVVTVTFAWRTTTTSCETVGSAVGH